MLGGAVAMAAGVKMISPTHAQGGTVTQPPNSALQTQAAGRGEVRVEVVYFGMPLQMTGTKEEAVVLIGPARLSDLEGLLANLHPSLRACSPRCCFKWTA